MKRNQIATLVISTLFAVSLSACGAQTRLPMQIKQPVQAQKYQAVNAQQILVRFHGQLSRARIAEFNAKYGISIRQFLPDLNVYVVEVPDSLGIRADRVVSYLQKDPIVAHAEVNMNVQIQPVLAEVQIQPIF